MGSSKLSALFHLKLSSQKLNHSHDQKKVMFSKGDEQDFSLFMLVTEELLKV